MKAADAILLALYANGEAEAAGGGRMPVGRTAAQKLVYFAAQRVEVEVSHYAHYYGPYSDGVSLGIARLWGKGFAREDPPTRAKPGYTYALTEHGERLGAMATGKDAKGYAAVRSIVLACRGFCGLREPQMVLASQIHYMVARKGVPRGSVEGLASMGLKMGWELGEGDVRVGQELLCRLGLDGQARAGVAAPPSS